MIDFPKLGWIDEDTDQDLDEDDLPDTLRQEDLEKILKKIMEENDGSKCKICKDWFQYAESNQEDGTFICRSCKLNPYRSSSIDPDE